MNRLTYAAAAALALAGFGLVGCERDDGTASTTTTTTTTRTPAQTQTTAGEDMDNAADRTANAAENVGDNLKEGAQEAGAAIKSGANRAGEGLKDLGSRAKDAGKDLGRKVDGAINRTGDAASSAAAPDAGGVHTVLAKITEAALTKGGLDDLAERLVDADRNRLGAGVEAESPELDGRIDQFTKDWQAKYNQKFAFDDAATAFPANTFMISTSETPQGAAGVSVDVDRSADGAAVDVDTKSGVDQPGTDAADTNRNDPGRDRATLRVAASGDMPELTVPLIHEAPDAWKIDVPDTLTADKLRQNVLAHLTAANEMKDQWPADANQAKAAIAHHVLMALMDKPVQK